MNAVAPHVSDLHVWTNLETKEILPPHPVVPSFPPDPALQFIEDTVEFVKKIFVPLFYWKITGVEGRIKGTLHSGALRASALRGGWR